MTTADEKQYFWRLWGDEEQVMLHRCVEDIWMSLLLVFGVLYNPLIASTHVLLNALLAAKALDFSALSPETCSALRGLGVEIPEEVGVKDALPEG